MRTLRPWLAVTLFVAAFFPFTARAAEAAALLFQRGIFAEETEGDLKAAIAFYEQIVMDSTDRAVVAQAYFRLASCYERTGDRAVAGYLFRELMRQFPDETALGEEAQRRLSTLMKAPHDGAARNKAPVVFPGAVAAVSPDGRFFAAWSGSHDVVVADVATGRTTTLFTASGAEHIAGGLAFSPDSERIAFDIAGRSLRVANADGSEAMDLPVKPDGAPGEFTLVGWTPDAARLIVARRGAGNAVAAPVLGEVELATATWREIKALPAGVAGFPFLAVDGERLALEPLASAACLEAGAVKPAAGAEAWAPTGAMVLGRSLFGLAPLPSGKILALGGNNSSVGSRGYLNQAETYDPATGTWTAVAPMPYAHRLIAAVLANGEVLAVGDDDVRNPRPTAYRFNEVAAAWTSAGAPSIVRYAPVAVTLAEGRVLLAGGYNGGGGHGAASTYATAEVFDLGTNSWSSAPPMAESRHGHTGTRLYDGRVLVVGGSQRDGPTLVRASAELFDPVAATWVSAAAMRHARSEHQATLLPSGRVLVTGGYSADTVTAQSTAEIYHPVTNTWASAGSMACARLRHTAVLLPSGKVLVAGGGYAGGPLATAEIFDPVTETWTTAPAMATRRRWHAMALLPDGNVLVAGGQTVNAADTATAEIYRVDVAAGARARP